MRCIKAILFTFLLITVSLTGCIGEEDSEDEPKEILGCTTSTANNYVLEATEDDGSCYFDSDNDGVLDENEIAGCLDPASNNYDSAATDEIPCDYDLDNDGVLDADEVLGCTDDVANNHNTNATDDDDSCDYDLDDDGITDSMEVSGCGNPFAANYNSTVTDEDPGSCIFYSQISAGSAFTCAIRTDGNVSCWGWNNNGQLGRGMTSGEWTEQPNPTQTASLGEGRTAVMISSGSAHTCAILDDGSVSCWGRNSVGQLGDGTTTHRNTPTQITSLGEGRTAVMISSGSVHTCAILDDGSVSCWGGNEYNGQLGDGSMENQYRPTQTANLGEERTAIAISSGQAHTCAILDDGNVSCWGSNGAGQLGLGHTDSRSTPTQITNFSESRIAISIATGWSSTCVILDDGNVSCWGDNGLGAIGDGTQEQRNNPTQTSSLGEGRTAIAIAADRSQVCVILDNGYVSCWGDNVWVSDDDFVESTNNSMLNSDFLTVPHIVHEILISHDLNASEISAGPNHVCVILENSSVICWGSNYFGQQGGF